MSKQFEDIAVRYARLKSLLVGILVFFGAEVLDFTGPFEVFSVAAWVHRRNLSIELPFKVSLIGACRETITDAADRISSLVQFLDNHIVSAAPDKWHHPIPSFRLCDER
jgi:hypothetical protein